MTVLRTIKALAADNSTEMIQLNIQDGGQAAEIICVQDWRTEAELRDIATACVRMPDVISAYVAEPSALPDDPATGGV